MEVVVTPEHFNNSKGYSNIFDCPLALALKEIFPNKTICVTTHLVSIGECKYYIDFPETWKETVLRLVGKHLPDKQLLPPVTETHTVTLTLAE